MSCIDLYLDPVRHLANLISYLIAFGVHYAGYYPFARRLVVSEKYRHWNVRRLTAFMAAGPSLWVGIIWFSDCAGTSFVELIVLLTILLTPFIIWGLILINTPLGPAWNPASKGLPFALGLPVIGALVALSWVAASHGLNELVGFDSSKQAERRGHVIGVVGFILLAALIPWAYFKYG